MTARLEWLTPEVLDKLIEQFGLQVRGRWWTPDQVRRVLEAAAPEAETPLAKPKITTHWAHTHGDVVEYECKGCGAEWEDDVNGHPRNNCLNAPPSKGRTRHE